MVSDGQRLVTGERLGRPVQNGDPILALRAAWVEVEGGDRAQHRRGGLRVAERLLDQQVARRGH
jgi:hypothetical protein